MTRESNSVPPSSRTSVGMLPSGFCCRTLSLGSSVSAFSIRILSSRPRIEIAILIFRAKGEVVDERRTSIFYPLFIPDCFCNSALREVDRFRSFAAIVVLDIERNFLAFAQCAETRARHRRNVHEHVAASAVGRDKSKTLVAIEELHGAGQHGLNPFSLSTLASRAV